MNELVPEGVFFLSSLDSTSLMPVRRCTLLRPLAFDTGKPALEVAVDPPVVGQDFNRDDITTTIMVARHTGDDVAHIREFPCFVQVTIWREGLDRPESPIRADDVVVIGWGELYRTAADAANCVFDKSAAP